MPVPERAIPEHQVDQKFIDIEFATDLDIAIIAPSKIYIFPKIHSLVGGEFSLEP